MACLTSDFFIFFLQNIHTLGVTGVPGTRKRYRTSAASTYAQHMESMVTREASKPGVEEFFRNKIYVP